MSTTSLEIENLDEFELTVDLSNPIESLAELFANAPIIHGQLFDDNRRWCATCESPKIIQEFKVESPWSSKICVDCSSIWPEFIPEFIESVNNDDESLSPFELGTIN